MVKHYLKIALRFLFRHKGHTAINILGLSVGICCCILIMLFVSSEFMFDRFHSKAGNLYRAWQEEHYEGKQFINTVTPLSMGEELKQAFPEVQASCRIYALKPVIKLNGKSFAEDVRMVDSSFFQMFDFPLLKGNSLNPFPTANAVILTPGLAKKYFGDSDPLGKSLELKLGNDLVPFMVSGIVQEAPEASSIKYKMLISYANSKYLFRPQLYNSWTNVFNETYIQLKPGTEVAALEKKFLPLVKKVLGEDYREGGFLIHLQPITDIHLNKDLPAGIEPISNPKYSYILASIALLILLVACINFITLSIGRSATRAMEVGVRKTMGALRGQLIRQFWGEALLLTLISVFLGLALSWLLLSPFNILVERNLSIQPDKYLVVFFILLMFFVALVAGIYPAIVLSGFNPVEVLKGKISLKENAGWLRRSLVVGQFVASISLIICALVIGKQLNYIQTKDLGYAKEQVVVVQTNKSRNEGMPLAELYRTSLLSHPEVSEAAVSVYSLAEPQWVQVGFTDEKNNYRGFQYNAVDPHFLQAMGMKTMDGRFFDPANPSDITDAAVVNEAFIKEFNITNPVGKKLPGAFEQRIIGVVRDFNYKSLRNKVDPLVMTISPDSVLRHAQDISLLFPPQPRITVRIRPGNVAASLAVLKSAWKSVAPDQEFDYRFLDEAIATQYKSEQRTASIVQIATGLSVFIACMGLFGLVTLTVTRRKKEIGIRKVMGAGTARIVQLIAYDFVKMVFIAALVAFPLAWWFLNDWLKDFAYKTGISWWIFALAALLAMLVALLTVGFQATRAALANPVNSLRSE